MLGELARLTAAPERSDGELQLPAESAAAAAEPAGCARRTTDACRVEGSVSLDDLRRVFPGY